MGLIDKVNYTVNSIQGINSAVTSRGIDITNKPLGDYEAAIRQLYKVNEFAGGSIGIEIRNKKPLPVTFGHTNKKSLPYPIVDICPQIHTYSKVVNESEEMEE